MMTQNPPLIAIGLVAIAAALPVLTPTAQAADKAAIYTGLLSDVAVEGYDTVALLAGDLVRGDADHTATYKGAEWRFASAQSLAQFEADPARYAPQYGGYCAWAVSQGYTAKGDPENASVVDGKLYLNINASIQERWLRDPQGFIAAANRNWPGVLQN